MQSIKSDLRYAKELFNYSIKKTYVLEKIYYEMQHIIDMLDISNDLYHFLRNPFLNSKRKWIFLSLIFKMEDFSSTLIKLIQLRGIAYAFMSLCNRKKKWVQINVITAVPLSNPIEEYIIKIFQKSNPNRKYFLEKKVNNSIIGGFILRIEDKEWDSSLEENIRKLKIHLKNHI